MPTSGNNPGTPLLTTPVDDDDDCWCWIYDPAAPPIIDDVCCWPGIILFWKIPGRVVVVPAKNNRNNNPLKKMRSKATHTLKKMLKHSCSFGSLQHCEPQQKRNSKHLSYHHLDWFICFLCRYNEPRGFNIEFRRLK